MPPSTDQLLFKKSGKNLGDNLQALNVGFIINVLSTLVLSTRWKCFPHTFELCLNTAF